MYDNNVRAKTYDDIFSPTYLFSYLNILAFSVRAFLIKDYSYSRLKNF